MKSKNKLDYDSMLRISQAFDTDERLVPFSALEVSRSLPLKHSLMLAARLERAAGNQLSDGDATVSRYAIWAETVRGIILDAIECLDTLPEHSDKRRNLIKAANSLAAFSSIQSELDPFNQ